MSRTSKLLVPAVALLGLLGAACGSDSSAATTSSVSVTTAAPTTMAPTTTEPAVIGEVKVSAASSLTEAFTAIGAAFSTEHPGAKATFDFAASSDLVKQIAEGADAAVFASADQANMTKLTDAGDNGAQPVVFATNSLEIIVEPGNPKHITGVADLAKPDLIVVTCDPQVPIGKYSQQVFTNAGVTVTPKSLEQNVKGIVTKVTLGEADAGIVYATDVAAAGAKAAGVEIPANLNVVAQYPLVVTKRAADSVAARAFVDFVLGEQGRKILGSYGFTGP